MKKFIFSIISFLILLNFIFLYPILSVFKFSFYFVFFLLHILIFYSFTERVLKSNSVFLNFSFSFFIYSNIIFFLSVFKILKKTFFIFIILILFFLSIREFLRNIKKIYFLFRDIQIKDYIFFIFPVVIILIKIFMPPLDYDALGYHLNLPHIYIMNNGFINLNNFLFFNFPQFTEMVFAGILLLFPPWVTQILPFLFLIFSSVLSYKIFEEVYGYKDRFLLFIIFSTPSLIFYSATSYVDIVLMYYTVFSFYLFTKRNYFLSSFFAGICFSIKYTGITSILGIFFLFLIFERKKILNIFYSIIPYVPYFFKNIYWAKNPVYPFFSNDYLNYFNHVSHHGIGVGLKIFLLPYYLTYKGIKFGLGFDFIGPVYLILFIIFLFSFLYEYKRSSFNNEIKVMVFIVPSLIVWIFKSQVLRFLIPFLPLGLILLLKYRSKIYSSILCFSIFYNIIFSLFLFSSIGGFEFLSKKKADFLREKHPSYKGFEYLNSFKKSLNVLFYGETRGFYLNKKFTPVSVFDKHPLIEMVNKEIDLDKIIIALKEKYTHIFVSKFELKRLGINFTSSTLDRQKREKLLKLLLNFKKIYEDNNSIIYEL